MQFGLYLKNKAVITAEQLVAALHAQQLSLTPIGQLALEEGLLSARDIFNILQAQKEAPRELFGELAIEMGLLSREEVMRLLMMQSNRRQPIAEILKEQGVLTDLQLAIELAAFRQEMLQPQQYAIPRRKAEHRENDAIRWSEHVMAEA